MMEGRKVMSGKQVPSQQPVSVSASGTKGTVTATTEFNSVSETDKLPPQSIPPATTNSSNSGGSKTSTCNGGGTGTHLFRLGGLSRYLMEKAQSNDSGLDLSPATLQTLVHPLRTSNSSSSSLHVRTLFESPASDASPIPSKDTSKNEEGLVPSPPHVSKSVLNEQSHNSSETTVIEKTITDETTSKDLPSAPRKEPLNTKTDNIRVTRMNEGHHNNNRHLPPPHPEKNKQYYPNPDNITPKDRIFQVPYGQQHPLPPRQDAQTKERCSSGGNRENTDPAYSSSSGAVSSRSQYQSNNNNNGNYSSEIAAVISTGGSGVSENVKKYHTPAAMLQTPKIKSCKKKPNPPQTEQKQSSKKQTGWKFLSEHVQGKEFLILEQLGKGGCGEVSLVMEKGTRKQYALKVVQLHGIDDAAVQECINEVEMLIDLKGTDLVVDIHSWEFNRSEKTMKILMEKGQCDLHHTINKAIKMKMPIKLVKLKYIWESLLTIVEKIHSRGIVHADLKPANFVWFEDNLKLIDFGIASRLQSDLTSIAMANPKGTLNFISPEIIRPDDTGRSKLSPKSDIWALGCILYFMVYGHSPFEHISHPARKMTAILQGDIVYPTLPPHLHGSEVISVLKLCFQTDYKRRPSASELLRHRFLNS